MHARLDDVGRRAEGAREIERVGKLGDDARGVLGSVDEHAAPAARHLEGLPPQVLVEPRHRRPVDERAALLRDVTDALPAPDRRELVRRSDEHSIAREARGVRVAVDVNVGNPGVRERIREARQHPEPERLDRPREAEVVVAAGVHGRAADRLHGRRRDRPEQVRRAREALILARHDQRDLGAALEAMKADLLQLAEQELPRRGLDARVARGVDGRAVPAVAVDGHVEVEAAQAVRERDERAVERVLVRERREPRRRADPELRRVGEARRAGEVERPAADRPVLAAPVVVVEADEVSDLLERGQAERQPAVPERHVVHHRHAVHARALEARAHLVERADDQPLVERRPVEVHREPVGVLRVEAHGRRAVLEGGVLRAVRRVERVDGRVALREERVPLDDGVGVIVLAVRAVAEVVRGLVVDLQQRDGTRGPEPRPDDLADRVVPGA